MTTQTALDSIKSLLGESREAVLSSEKTSLGAIVHARNGRVVIFGAPAEAGCRDGWQAVGYAVAKQRVLA